MRRRGWLIWLSAAAIIVLWLAAVACGEIINVPLVRQEQGEGILAEIQARLPYGVPREPSWIGTVHEGTHYLNSHIRNRLSRYGGFSTGNAGYLYGGEAFVLPNPPVRISEAMRLAGVSMPSWDARMAAQWDHWAGYVVDELSAYIAGTVAGLQYGWDSNHTLDGSYKRALQCWHVLRAVEQLARQRNYSHADELADFLTVTGRYLNTLRPYVARAK